VGQAKHDTCLLILRGIAYKTTGTPATSLRLGEGSLLGDWRRVELVDDDLLRNICLTIIDLQLEVGLVASLFEESLDTLLAR